MYVRPAPPAARIQYIVFDIVYSDGTPCHTQPLTERLAKLGQLWESHFVSRPTAHVRLL